MYVYIRLQQVLFDRLAFARQAAATRDTQGKTRIHGVVDNRDPGEPALDSHKDFIKLLHGLIAQTSSDPTAYEVSPQGTAGCFLVLNTSAFLLSESAACPCGAVGRHARAARHLRLHALHAGQGLVQADPPALQPRRRQDGRPSQSLLDLCTALTSALPFLDLCTALTSALPWPLHCLSLASALPFLDLCTAFP